MAKHRSHSVESKRQVAQEIISGETLNGLAKRHDVSRNLIRIWVRKYEQGAFGDDAQAADLILECEAGSPHSNGRLTSRLWSWSSKGALKSAPRPRSGITAVISGPAASPSRKDAG